MSKIKNFFPFLKDSRKCKIEFKDEKNRLSGCGDMGLSVKKGVFYRFFATFFSYNLEKFSISMNFSSLKGNHK